VIDTNLLVGHLFRPEAPGPAEILERWRTGRVRVCVSPPVVREIRATLRRLPIPARRKQALFDLLEDPERTEQLDGIPDSGFRCSDVSDEKFLHLAVAADADALITSDRALHAVADFPVPVMKSGQWVRSQDRCKD
jgi:putative PIN family toxin of toxin-antitoxin system